MQIDGNTQIQIKVGNQELLTSGIVHLEHDQRIQINIDGLSFAFIFKNDADSTPRYEGSVVNSILEFTLFNHRNSFGEGILNPIEVATLNNRVLSLTYYVHTINSEKCGRRFEYAFYLGQYSV